MVNLSYKQKKIQNYEPTFPQNLENWKALTDIGNVCNCLKCLTLYNSLTLCFCTLYCNSIIKITTIYRKLQPCNKHVTSPYNNPHIVKQTGNENEESHLSS